MLLSPESADVKQGECDKQCKLNLKQNKYY